MSESYIQLPPDSTGKKARALKRTVVGEEVHEECFAIVEPVAGEVVDPRTLLSGTGPVIAKVSGETVTQFEGDYKKVLVSGAVIRNISDKRSILHTITINDVTSGRMFRVRDAVSGATGVIIGEVWCGTRAMPAAGHLRYDCMMQSGIVVDTSGATWNLTVTYRQV